MLKIVLCHCLSVSLIEICRNGCKERLQGITIQQITDPLPTLNLQNWMLVKYLLSALNFLNGKHSGMRAAWHCPDLDRSLGIYDYAEDRERSIVS